VRNCQPGTGSWVLSCADPLGNSIFQYCDGISIGKTLQCEAITLIAVPLCVVVPGG
jgi:hypothetical protein